ncbi:hypothetical protein GCM10009547_39500 [Sporichthya brevicatena]|uniref:Uncharacterized protein n=1 Tax=Sporichthya brevicatena TaxID=171442 RepID=A0ABP3SBH2_9ACTN
MTTPWTRVDVLRTAVLVAVGAVVWAVGWFGVSGEPALSDQIAPMNVAVLGVILVGAGYASWFLAGRRAVGARRRVVLALVPDVASAPAPDVRADDVRHDGFLGSGRLFHRSGCAMTADRAWVAEPRSVHEQAGRVPCGVCRP